MRNIKINNITLHSVFLVITLSLLHVLPAHSADDPDWQGKLEASPSYIDAKRTRDGSAPAHRDKHHKIYSSRGVDTSRPQQLNKQELRDIDGYTDAPDSYDIGSGENDPVHPRANRNVKSFNRGLEDLPAIEDDIYSAQIFTLGEDGSVLVEEGDYIVNAFRPWSFTDNPDSAVLFIRKKLGGPAGQRVVIYQVDQSMNGKIISPISTIEKEAEVAYRAGSQFRVSSINNIALQEGEQITSIKLTEVDSIPAGSKIYDNKVNRAPLTEAQIERVPEEYRIRVRDEDEVTGAAACSIDS